MPIPPNEVQAVHVGIGTNSASLVMIWTQVAKFKSINRNCFFNFNFVHFCSTTCWVRVFNIIIINDKFNFFHLDLFYNRTSHLTNGMLWGSVITVALHFWISTVAAVAPHESNVRHKLQKVLQIRHFIGSKVTVLYLGTNKIADLKYRIDLVSYVTCMLLFFSSCIMCMLLYLYYYSRGKVAINIYHVRWNPAFFLPLFVHVRLLFEYIRAGE